MIKSINPDKYKNPPYKDTKPIYYVPMSKIDKMSSKHQNDPLHLPSMVEIKISQDFPYKEMNPSAGDNTCTMEKKTEKFAGRHYIVDFWGKKFLQDIKVIEKALKDAANVAGAILLHIHLHQFSDYGGITGVALLAESHISVHTWPENDYAAFDVFMCGDAQPEKAVELLQRVFQPEKVAINEIFRGKLP